MVKGALRFIIFLGLLTVQYDVLASKDSLLQVWGNSALPDTARAKAIHALGWKLRTSNPDSTIVCGRLALGLYTKQRHIKGIDDALNEIGIGHLQNSAYDSAIFYFNRCFENALQRKDFVRMGVVKVNISIIYGMQDKLYNALEELTTGILYLEKGNDTAGVIKSRLNLGIIHRKLGEYEKAKAIYLETVVKAREIGLSETEALAYNNLANVYELLHQTDSALYYYRLALPINIKNSNMQGEARVYQNLSETFRTMERFDSALYYAHRSLHIQQHIGDVLGATTTLLSLASIHDDLHQLDSSFFYANMALKNSELIQSLEDQINAHSILSRIFETKGNYKEALYHYKLKVHFGDSLSSSENLKAIAQQEMKYQYRKEKEADSIAHAQQMLFAQQQRDHQMKLAEEASRRNTIVLSATLLVLTLVGGIAFILYRSNKQRKKDNEIIRQQKSEVEHQKELVEEKNAEITDSITYAKRIQSAILPPVRVIRENFTEAFVFYQPKDIVAGDFYWAEKLSDRFLLSVADCTGHGVPGALVSVVCHNALNRSVREFGLTQTSSILNKTRELVIETFSQSADQVKDGMDCSIVSVKKGNRESEYFIEYSGANNPIYVLRNGELIELKGDKQPVGKFDDAKPFSSQELVLNSGDTIVLFSDGFADQFGGEKGKKLKYSTLKELLLQNQEQTLDQMQNALQSFFNSWKGSLEQVDDVCLIGIRL